MEYTLFILLLPFLSFLILGLAGMKMKHQFLPSRFVEGELDVQTIGYTLMGMGKYQYVLPFEVISILLLACIVGGIMIARKR